MRMSERLRALEAKAGPDLSHLSDEEIQDQIRAFCERLTAIGLPIEPNPDLHLTVAELKAMLSAGT